MSAMSSEPPSRRVRGRPAPAPEGPVEIASQDPVARVLVDVLPAHLDRTFDYAVPATMAAQALPGTRVKVRFAGRVVDGFVTARTSTTDHAGALTPLRRLVSAETVLRPEIAELAGTVARRYAGTRPDVLRLAVPPRHARAEQSAPLPQTEAPELDPVGLQSAWVGHPAGASYLHALARGERPRAVWTAAPATDWPAAMASAAATAYAAGRGALVLAPDGRDLDRLDASLTTLLGPGHHVALRADAGPSRRYRDFLAVSRGTQRIVLGTRAAAFAPVHDLGLVAIWDDGDDLYAEPRGPYPHAREVLLLRAEQQQTAVLVGGFARSVEAHHLVRAGWAREIAPERAVVRERANIAVAGAADHELARDPHARAARLPRTAHDAIRTALEVGPVLVQTPRSGYATALACERCRTPARCRHCTGPLRIDSPVRPPDCRWCGRDAPGWACEKCGDRGLRAPTVGEARTAEELGRSFPGVRVLTSRGGQVRAEVPDHPAIVVATPGSEPVADAGYAAVVLLDTWLALARTDLRVAEEALRRWLGAAGLVRAGGRVVAVGDPSAPALQALVRWDPTGFVDRESAERRSAHLPPASRLATIVGDPEAVAEALTQLRAPPGLEVLGPMPEPADAGTQSKQPGTQSKQPGSPPRSPPGSPLGSPLGGTSSGPAAAPSHGTRVRAVVRVPRREGDALSGALGEMQRLRASRKLTTVRVQVDPPSLS